MTCQLCYGKGYITGSEGTEGWVEGCECITGEVDLFTFAKQIGFKECGDELIYELPQGDFHCRFANPWRRKYDDWIIQWRNGWSVYHIRTVQLRIRQRSNRHSGL